MEKLGVLLDAAILPKNILPILKFLGPEHATVYWRRDRIQPELARAITDMGFELVPLDGLNQTGNQFLSHKYYFIDYHFSYFSPKADILSSRDIIRNWVDGLRAQGKLFIGHTYSMEDSPRDERWPTKGDFFLSPCEESTFMATGNGKFLCDAQGRPEIGRSSNGNEVVTVGLFHVPDQIHDLARADKKELKSQLADKLGVSFDPNLPVALYSVTMGNESKAVDKGLMKLAQGANVVLKHHPDLQHSNSPELAGLLSFYGQSRASGPNIHIMGSKHGRLDWATRFAADVCLVDPWGGGFFTALMTGLRFIIVHSTRMLTFDDPRVPVNYTRFLRDSYSYPWVRAAYSIAPINIESADMIIDRINDTEYWGRFDQEIARVAQGLLGRFWFGTEAAERAASFIKRVLDRGTFTPTSQEMPGAKVANGPLSHGFLRDFVL